ncbi:MAG TPA: ABC transporter permease subunit [Bacilli bacterium]|nr:MAG: Carnitine transport permease protein OpuCD [Tenericutes bacterium ADurb.BinA124]HNZ50153.1 ABC transporter permease subunit [Bacilli bacterium]HOH17967.1 ABC transporter permease subunit [Bacilli bacterium]HPN61106.1 ABC transporter permease subunit [Bacilli bacterium]HPX84790.1 ABC transporter permease subunit [Bacilli bacterium]
MKKPFKGYYVSGLLFLFLIWIISSAIIKNDLAVPRFLVVVQALKIMIIDSATWLAIGNTCFSLLVTVLICFGVALLLSILVVYFKGLELFLSPLLAVLRTIPVIVVMVVLLMVFGNRQSPMIMTGFVLLPLLYEQYVTAFKTTNLEITDDLSLLGATKWQAFRFVYFPLSFPVVLSSLVQSFGLGLKVMVMAEYLASPKQTIGYALMQAVTTLNTALVFAWTVILIIFVLLVETLIKKIRIEKW